jgi:hypothetical protein
MSLILGILDSGGAAAGGGASYESIASATGTGSSGTITFSSIPATYTHLQIRYIGRQTTDGGSDNTIIRVRFNSDSASNYRGHYLGGNGTSPSAAADGSLQTAGYMMIADSGALANTMGVGIVDIHNYSSTTINKTTRAFNGFDQNGAGGLLSLRSFLYLSTSAISSIELTTTAGNFTTSSQFSLYGIKG